MQSSFFSMILRMKYINRWGLMRNTCYETLSQHSLDVAVIAHALAVINNKRLSGNINPEKAAVYGLFHDVSEIITGDLPTPIKYHDDEMKTAYKQVENASRKSLLSLLPPDLTPVYGEIFECEDIEIKKFVKAADKLAGLIKCLDEELVGNKEFIKAKESQISALEELDMPEAQIFMKEFLESFEMTLDELR